MPKGNGNGSSGQHTSSAIRLAKTLPSSLSLNLGSAILQSHPFAPTMMPS
jgi:hypothetical protein